MIIEYPQFGDICWVADAYSGEKDYGTTYLGVDKILTTEPTVKLTAIFSSTDEVDAFFRWWKDETNDGTKRFLVQTTLFGANSTYGVEQISPLVHKSKTDGEEITLTVKIVFDSETVDNEPPEPSSLTVYIEEDSVDNFIVLSGVDPEGQLLTYDVTSGTDMGTYIRLTYGILTGTPPNLLYTPDESFSGIDSFNFTVSDVFNTSREEIVNIEVGQILRVDSEFKYTMFDPVSITGNYHYTIGNNGIVVRGKNGLITPTAGVSTFTGRASPATYLDENNVLQYVITDEGRYINGIIFTELASTNIIPYSEDFTQWTLYRVSANKSLSKLSINGTSYMTELTATDNTYSYGHPSTYAISCTNGSYYTMSYIVSKDTAGMTTYFYVSSVDGRHAGIEAFDLDTATWVDSEKGQYTHARAIDDLGNGYYKVSFTFLYTGYSNIDVSVGIVLKTADGSNLTIGDTAYIDMAQMEEQEAHTSYIPTTGIASTRARDYVTYDLTIWSNDHKVDPRTPVVYECEVVNWGNRVDFTDFLRGQIYINAFTVANSGYIDEEGIFRVTDCKGEIFNGMFYGYPITVPLFDTSYGIYFQETFREYSGTTIPPFDYTSGIYFQQMLKDTTLQFVPDVDTYKGLYFQEFFMGATNLECLGGIDTTAALSTNSMFTDTPALLNPNSVNRDLILAGEDWISLVACSLTVDAITELTAGTCSISSIGSTCTASSTHTITDHYGTATSTYQWFSDKGTLVNATSQIVTVQQTIGADTTFTLWCDVTNDGITVRSAYTQFTHTVSTTYLVLDIAKQYSTLNLREYIDANNPLNKTDIYLTNSKVNCQFETGDLSVFNAVELNNTGEIQAFSRTDGVITGSTEECGLRITSSIKLLNSGYIRGCGGKGGSGGKGADDTYLVYSYSTSYSFVACQQTTGGNYWAGVIVYNNDHLLTWNGVDSGFRGNIGTTWISIAGLSGIYRKSSYVMATTCSHYTYFYKIERRLDTYPSRTGGIGGTGGRGIGYGTSSVDGTAGLVSSPTGGYSGGEGGSGQTWGTRGDTGSDGGGYSAAGSTAGSLGLDGGKGLLGSSFLVGGSIIGAVSGGVYS